MGSSHSVVDTRKMIICCQECAHSAELRLSKYPSVSKNASALLSAVPHGGMPIRGWFSEEPTLKESALSVERHSDCTVEKALIAPVPVLQMQDARG